MKPPEEANTSKIWRLKKTVYGLKDAARTWYRNVVVHVQDFGGVKSNLDPTIFIWGTEKSTKRHNVLTRGRFLLWRGIGFERDVVKRLEVGCEEKASFKDIGESIRQGGERLMMSQRHYCRGIKELERWHFK